MLEAYCDESGIQGNAAYCVVVGFVASARQWRLFERRWSSASDGVVFHGKRFFARDPHGNRVKPYAGWDEWKATAYLVRLVGAITLGAFTPVGAVIDTGAFGRLTMTERKLFTGRLYHRRQAKWMGSGAPTKPYFLGFSECVMGAARCVRKSGWTVDFVFDQQHEFRPYATEYFRAVKKHVPAISKRLGELAFKDRAEVPGLQAADMLAHACYRRTATNVGANRELDLVTSRLRSTCEKRILLYNETQLRHVLKLVPTEVHRALQERP